MQSAPPAAIPTCPALGNRLRNLESRGAPTRRADGRATGQYPLALVGGGRHQRAAGHGRGLVAVPHKRARSVWLLAAFGSRCYSAPSAAGRRLGCWVWAAGLDQLAFPRRGLRSPADWLAWCDLGAGCCGGSLGRVDRGGGPERGPSGVGGGGLVGGKSQAGDRPRHAADRGPLASWPRACGSSSSRRRRSPSRTSIRFGPLPKSSTLVSPGSTRSPKPRCGCCREPCGSPVWPRSRLTLSADLVVARGNRGPSPRLAN